MQKVLLIAFMALFIIVCNTDTIVETKVPQQIVITKEVSRGEVSRIPLYDIPLDEVLQRHIYDECLKNGVDQELILKVIKHESNFDAGATNGQYVGLMQLSKKNADWAAAAFGYESAYNPYCNTSAGISIIAGLMHKYKDPHMALMAYNKGEAGAKEYWNNNIYTTNYTNSIILTNLTILSYY